MNKFPFFGKAVNFINYIFLSVKIPIGISFILIQSLVRGNRKKFRADLELLQHLPEFLMNKLIFKISTLTEISKFVISSRLSRDSFLADAHSNYLNANSEASLMNISSATKVNIRAREKLFGNDQHLRLIGSEITQSIGHLAVALGSRARFKILNSTREHYLVLSGTVANRFYLHLWEKHFPILELNPIQVKITESTLWPLFDSVQTLEIGDQKLDLYQAHNKSLQQWTAENCPPLLEFPQNYLDKCFKYLGMWGFKPGTWFVALHIRENRSDKPGYGRNSDPATYVSSIKEVILQGGMVIRIGDTNCSKLEPIEGFIDLTRERNRPEWIDIFVLSQCKFLIGTTSGPLVVPQTFGVPVLATNAPDIGRFAYYPNSLMIPKLVENLDNGKLLSIKDLLDSKAAVSDAWIDGDRMLRLRWRDNSSEEIKDGVLEMLEENRIPSDSQLKVESLLMNKNFSGTSLISSRFIISHPEVFED